MKAYHDSLVNESAKNGRPVQDLDKWEQAITSAFEVLGKFRSAEMKRRDQLVDEANTIVGQAMEHLQHRYGSSVSSRIANNCLFHAI